MYEDMVIHTAETKHQIDAPDLVMLEITDELNPEPYLYALDQHDPFGAAPTLRRKLQTMVDEEGFEIVGGLPAGWPWWVEPEPVPPDTGP